MTEAQLREKVVDTINAWVGGTKGSKQHLDILSVYNEYRPLARGHKVLVNEAYCATTVSAAYIRAGIAAYTGTECSVSRFTKIAQERGIWEENDAHVPKLGDACVYDWDDNGVGDCVGAGDHIGIVTEVGNGAFVVTEGNMPGGKVGKRSMKVNGRYIRGFITPDFAAIARAMGGKAAIHRVKAGDTLSKIAAAYGTSMADLVEINDIKNPDMIRVGQVIYLPTTAGACEKLADLGVLTSPDYWAWAAGKVKYLDILLVKAAGAITKAGPRTATWQEGLEVLVAKGVVNTPKYWEQNVKTVPNLGALLCALGGAVK